MLDFSFGEILVIAIIAVIFLGPDKLPQTFVKIAKFLRAVKKTINDAKDTLDREIHITEMKQDALEYKKKFEDSALKLKDDILQSADLEPTKTKLQSELEGLKSEIDSLKIADKLNAPLDKSSVKNLTFDEVESKGQALQNRLKRNLKTKDLGESTKTRIAKVSGESSAKKTSVSKATKKVAKSAKASESKKDSKKSVKDSADSKRKKRKKAESAIQTNSKSKKPKKRVNNA